MLNNKSFYVAPILNEWLLLGKNQHWKKNIVPLCHMIHIHGPPDHHNILLTFLGELMKEEQI